VAIALSGCTSGHVVAPRHLAAATTSTTAPILDPAVRYEPAAGEPVPDIKRLATDAIQSLLTFPASEDQFTALRERVAAAGLPPAVEATLGGFCRASEASEADIVYPQLGGLTDRAASVMVVTRQRVVGSGRLRATVRTIDVRLAKSATGWRVVDIASNGVGPPRSAAPPTAEVAAVLANPRIRLPDSARDDLLAGTIDARVVALLALLGASHDIDVTVLASGHPIDVFDRMVTSNHTVGRAVDIWAVDGRPVVDQRNPDSGAHQLAQELFASGVQELGSPWDFDGPARSGSFTNVVHQDHLHLAYDAAK